MLRKTHLAIGLASAMYFLPHINNKPVFFVSVLLFTLLPDIDRSTSLLSLKFWSKNRTPSPSHRGFLHSYTFCILISVILALFYPILALPFFIGYSLHLFADGFTVKGIRPFWPLKISTSGKIVTGSKVEDVVFWTFVLIDVFLFVFLFF